MEKLISIIVPVYKVEAYLRECIDSIIGQTYKNWELFLVDDGSPDSCGDICDSYAEADKRISVIHKENGGLSDARNCALEKVSGDYITFIDSDDYISENYLQCMLSYANCYDADIVQCDYSRDKNLLNEQKDKKEKEITIIEGEEILRDYLRFKKPEVLACAKLYRKELFTSLRFPVGYIDEDNYTTYITCYYAKIFVNINRVLYYYRINQESISNRPFTEKKFGILQSTDAIRSFLDGKTTAFDKDVDYYEMRELFQAYNNAIQAHAEEKYQHIIKDIVERLTELSRKNIQIDVKYKLLLFLLLHNEKIYKKMILALRR